MIRVIRIALALGFIILGACAVTIWVSVSMPYHL